MDFAPLDSPSAAKRPAPPARPDLMPADSSPKSKRPSLFGFTTRLTPEQVHYFQTLAIAKGHPSVAAAFKAQALCTGMDHPLNEMRISLEHMQERISEEGAWLQDRIQYLSHALDALQRHTETLVADMQTCTDAMLLFAQTNEALSMAVADLKGSGGRPSHRFDPPGRAG